MGDVASIFGGPASEQAWEEFSETTTPHGQEDVKSDSGKSLFAAESVVADGAVSEEISKTPSGIEVLYQSQPKRLYKLRHDAVDGGAYREVPSVTTVLKVLDKPALSWWGMKVGVRGIQNLVNEGHIIESDVVNQSDERLVEILKEQRLTVNHVRDQAGDRGNSVHTAFEMWARYQNMPNPDLYPEEERGYIVALGKFLEECKPEPVKSEVMVGSLKHGYAGRFDLLAYQGGHEIVTHLTPKSEKRGVIEPGLGLWDLKTSSGVYPETHYRQLEAYEEASVECGYQPTDFRAVIHVCADGRYQVKQSTATFEQFRNVLDVYNDNRDLKGKT